MERNASNGFPLFVFLRILTAEFSASFQDESQPEKEGKCYFFFFFFFFFFFCK